MPSDRPKLAVIVANNIRGDSRVQKSALAAAYAGWDVTLVGRASGDEIERSTYGPVEVIRVPVPLTLSSEQQARTHRRDEAFALTTARHEARSRKRSASGAVGHLWAGVTDQGFRVRRRLHRRAGGAPTPGATGDWRKDWPGLVDLDLAFGPVLEDLAPDVIHANDITMLQVGASVAARLRARGKRVAWLYDAHEYVPGVDWPDERRMAAYPALERELIGAADAVVTVSPEIADLLVKEYDLPETPVVVRNTPIRAAVGTGEVSVRAAAGLSADVPLLVYSGYLHPQRGIGTAVRALPDLPGVHLAVVTGQRNRELRELLKLAVELDVRDRVHVVPYVAQQHVADYLSSADAGVICSQRTINYELSLPTKLAEYLHAGIPAIVSDVKTLAAFVRDHEVGEVFVADDPSAFREAAARTLANRDQLRAGITDAVLDDLSWEHQSAGLVDLYTRISGITPPSYDRTPTWEVYEAPRRVPGPATGAGLPSGRWRPMGDTPVRLGLGPANFAGQLGAFAQAITDRRADVSCEVVIHASKAAFGYPADVKIRKGTTDRLDVQLREVERILPRYTHLIADAFRPVFGQLNGVDIAGDLPALRHAGIQVALLAHGSDVRHPLRHLERYPDSLYADVPDDETLAERIAETERNQQIAASAGLPLFVTTPDLLADLPTATWAPLVVDVDAWHTEAPVFERRRPIVLHAPSKRWTKGTDRFAAQLEELDRRGLIEFQLVEGVPWRTMRERVQAADVVIDQFSVGAYGVFAAEAMAAGKPVIAGLSPIVSEVVGETPPIVNARADAVAEAVERLLDDRDEAARIGAASRTFVRRHHDGARTVEALSGFLAP